MNFTKTTVTIFNHWLMAILILVLVGMGLFMVNYEQYQLYSLHKSLGILAFIFLVYRLYWRVKSPWISGVQGSSNEVLVKGLHLMMLLWVLLMVFSGAAYSGFGGYGVKLFGLTLVPSNYTADGKVIAFSANASHFGQLAHGYLGYALLILVATHVLGALKHHFINKDAVLLRMLGRKEN